MCESDEVGVENDLSDIDLLQLCGGSSGIERTAVQHIARTAEGQSEL